MLLRYALHVQQHGHWLRMTASRDTTLTLSLTPTLTLTPTPEARVEKAAHLGFSRFSLKTSVSRRPSGSSSWRTQMRSAGAN
jgi:hypothetical protein